MTLLCMTFNPSVGTRNYVIHFVRLMWVTINTGWQVQLPFGGPKQLQAFQGTIPSIKIFCTMIRFRGSCEQLGISTSTNKLQLQRCWIGAFTTRSPFQSHTNQIVHCCFVHASQLDVRLMQPLVVHNLCKVTHWHLRTFTYCHMLTS